MDNLKKLSGIEIIHNDCFEDLRGQLYTTWEQKNFINKEIRFNHDKIAFSKNNVLRGLHCDKSWKLITCVFGKIQFVVVNFNKNSNEYLHYQSFIIDSVSKTKTSILVPPMFLNGHLVLSENAVFQYKWSYEGQYPDIDQQTTIKWNDPKINIEWLSYNPILSQRDSEAKYL